MPIKLLTLWLLAFSCTPLCLATPRDQLFDNGWRFQLSDAEGVEKPSFDDSTWRQLDLPHDWSIEDLPPLEKTVPEISVVPGTWRFHAGDNSEWSAAQLDDSNWQQVTLPATWEKHSGHDKANVYGWFRKELTVDSDLKAKEIDLLLGRIDDADEVWLNGKRIGGTGSFPPNFQSAWETDRRYRIATSLLRNDGPNVLAIRVYDGAGEGGIYEQGVKSARIGPFDPQLSPGRDATGHTLGGIGWYRKAFTLGEENKRVAIRFDGVYMDSDVWLNGQHLGNHPHGYLSFEFDITPYLKPTGEENLLSVRVKNEGKNSRWYAGAGIYRHTWLTITEPIHVPTNGLFITTPEVSADQATVRFSTEICNPYDSNTAASIQAIVRDAEGIVVSTSQRDLTLIASKTTTLEQQVEVASPLLWSPDSPNLYSAEIKVVVAGKTIDQTSTVFGIRKIEVDAKNGFRLNGKSLYLRGGCIHHDNGPLGAVAIDRAEFRRVELMKASGFNAVRSSHNPPSPAFLDACDQLGLLVIDEAFDQWNDRKRDNHHGHHRFFKEWFERDIASMVRRDRNHPSIIMWSVGNEIPEQFRAVETGQQLRKAVLSHDTTRWVTQAICSDWGKVMKNWDELSDPGFGHLDVAGYNYLPKECENDHQRHPDRVMLGSESYPNESLAYWNLVEECPWVIGDFVWTSMDYLGEAGIGHSVLSNETNSFFMPWPWFNAWCGDLDLCGFKKPQSYYRDVVWRQSKIEMAVHTPIPEGLTETVSSWGWPDEELSWNWAGHEGKPLQVAVYSRCERVRLELNGKVIGEQPVSNATKLTARFTVPFAAGELRAFGLIDGKVVDETSLKTTGKPVKLRLTADHSMIGTTPNELSFVTVEVVDAEGNRVPNAKELVRFSVSGVGKIAGHASGSPNEPGSFQSLQQKTFQGRCLAILRPTGTAGEITLQVEAEGLIPASITVYCE